MQPDCCRHSVLRKQQHPAELLFEHFEDRMPFEREPLTCRIQEVRWLQGHFRHGVAWVRSSLLAEKRRPARLHATHWMAVSDPSAPVLLQHAAPYCLHLAAMCTKLLSCCLPSNCSTCASAAHTLNGWPRVMSGACS